MSAVLSVMKELEPEYIKIRRYLHQHPELSYNEVNTTEFIKQELTKYGIEVFNNGKFTGVIGVLKGSAKRKYRP